MLLVPQLLPIQEHVTKVRALAESFDSYVEEAERAAAELDVKAKQVDALAERVRVLRMEVAELENAKVSAQAALSDLREKWASVFKG